MKGVTGLHVIGAIMIICVVVMVFAFIGIAGEIQSIGLKGIVEQVWYGEGGNHE